MTKQPTAQGISALLRKAGFTRSTSSATRIRGHRDTSPGYRVHKHESGVSVGHVMASLTFDEARVRAELDRYRAVIEAAGYLVTEASTAFTTQLVVQAAPDLIHGPYAERADTKHSPVYRALRQVGDETWRELHARLERKDQVRREAVYGPLEAAGVELGDYDRTVLEQATERMEPAQLAALTGIIHRALAASPPQR